MNNLLIYIIGFISGLIAFYCKSVLKSRNEKKRKKTEINKQFLEIIKNTKQGKIIFRTRIKNTVFLESSLSDFGTVGIIIVMDKKEIHIFKNDKCIFNSESVDPDLLEKTFNSIKEQFQKNIEDVIDVMGVTISRHDFEKNINNQIREIKKNITKINEDNEISQILEKNKIKLDIDEILDKISSTGIDSLNTEELEFLKKHKG